MAEAPEIDDEYEVEVFYEDDAPGPNSLSKCKKNPGHERLIPVRTFRIENLPERYKDESIVEFIMNLASLTVCLKVCFVSKRRPDKYRNGKSYPYAEYKGSDKITRTGSGWIKSIFRDDRGGWNILIMTVHHVTFDNSEVEKTECLLDFDDENSSFITLHGKKVQYNAEVEEDYIEFICHTDDEDLVTRLDNQLKALERLSRRINQRYNCINPSRAHPLTVVASHPHGTSKRISIGEWKMKEDYRYNRKFTSYAYDAPTCRGSSGAPVWIFGTSIVRLFSRAHSKCARGYNWSGVGLQNA